MRMLKALKLANAKYLHFFNGTFVLLTNKILKSCFVVKFVLNALQMEKNGMY